MPDPMQPASAPTCKTREILKDRLRADLRVYVDAVAILEAAAVDGQDFNKAARDAATAQFAFETARDRYNQHVSSHACG
jgi:hypothetical protein